MSNIRLGKKNGNGLPDIAVYTSDHKLIEQFSSLNSKTTKPLPLSQKDHKIILDARRIISKESEKNPTNLISKQHYEISTALRFMKKERAIWGYVDDSKRLTNHSVSIKEIMEAVRRDNSAKALKEGLPMESADFSPHAAESMIAQMLNKKWIVLTPRMITDGITSVKEDRYQITTEGSTAEYFFNYIFKTQFVSVNQITRPTNEDLAIDTLILRYNLPQSLRRPSHGRLKILEGDKKNWKTTWGSKSTYCIGMEILIDVAAAKGLDKKIIEPLVEDYKKVFKNSDQGR